MYTLRTGLGQYDAAIEAFTKVIDMLRTVSFGTTEPLYCYLARGRVYAAKGMEREAKADFGKALGSMIKALRNPKEAMQFDYADDPLNHGQKLTREQSFAKMLERLRNVTGQDFTNDPTGHPRPQEAVIAAWELWWGQHAAEY